MTDDTHMDSAEVSFRERALEASRQSDTRIDCARVWHDLMLGRAVITHDFLRDERSFLVIARRSTEHPTSARNLAILERVLLGTDPKVVSIELDLASSTIACALKLALEAMGLRCCPSKVPLLFAMLARAAKSGAQLLHGRSGELEHRGLDCQLLSAPIPEPAFGGLLSPAVRAVVRMRVEGRSHAEIAATRRTSPRTVANQLAAAFQRLGISGRSDLIELMARY